MSRSVTVTTDVEIDVDIAEFEDSDLADELEERDYFVCHVDELDKNEKIKTMFANLNVSVVDNDMIAYLSDLYEAYTSKRMRTEDFDIALRQLFWIGLGRIA